MDAEEPAQPHLPGAQYLSAEYVIEELGAQGAHRLRTLTTPKVLVLGSSPELSSPPERCSRPCSQPEPTTPGSNACSRASASPLASSSSSSPVPRCSPRPTCSCRPRHCATSPASPQRGSPGSGDSLWSATASEH